MGTSRTTIFVALAIVAALLVAFGRPPKAAERGNVLYISTESPPDYLDPAMSYQVVSWQTMINTYNGLLTYRKESGTAGAQLVPDLAEAMPDVRDGGRTYSFRVRRGIMWGPPLKREVLPSDLKWAIERGFLMASPGSGFFLNIEGAQEFADKKTKAIEGIEVDDAARTITYRLIRPDATFLNIMALPFAFAVPRETPPKDQSLAGFIPATGPYMFVEYAPNRRIVIKRNPNFRQWTPDTPRGNVDGINIKLGVNPENSVTLIKRGKIDFMFGSIPRSKLPLLLKDEELRRQIHTDDMPSTSYIYMNTQVPPFNDRRARQAINWAIDRRAMVKLSGGLGKPSETILPPSMPGYRKHELYPGPDLDKARALLDEAGVERGKIDIWCRTNAPNPEMATYLQGVLNDLGFDATVKCVDSSNYFVLVGNEKTQAKIGFANWSQDYPEGSNFIDVLLNGARITPEHNNNLSRYKGADEQIAAANALLDPQARAAAWGALDEQIVRDGAWAPFMHGVSYVFTSERLTNYVQSPVYDLLFSKVKLKGHGADEGAAGGIDGDAAHVGPPPRVVASAPRTASPPARTAMPDGRTASTRTPWIAADSRVERRRLRAKRHVEVGS